MTTETRPFGIFGAFRTFFGAPFRLRTYTNILYLMLAFPLGLAYFIFLAVGIPLGLGLTIIWIGIPILALVLAGSWALTALERQSAIHLLGADVPPMLPPPVQAVQSFWQKAWGFFSNPVTWKGMAFLLLKLPLGIVTFVALVFSTAVTASFLLAPFFYEYVYLDTLDYEFGGDIYMDYGSWVIDTPGEAWMCFFLGLGLVFVTLNLLNGLAFLWARTAELLLGHRRFADAPPPAAMPDDGSAALA